MKKQIFKAYKVEGAIDVEGYIVKVPFVEAFVHKEYKHWYVRELTTGLQISYGNRTKDEAITSAIDILNRVGKEDTLKAITSKGIINNPLGHH